MLENPGLPGSGLITNALFCGLQAIGPGETAPAHRHSPNALRLIIESNGAYTTVAGERVVMHRGDLVLTPGWAWHGHGHVGSKPAIWLDALDLAFGHLFGKIFRESGSAGTQPMPPKPKEMLRHATARTSCLSSITRSSITRPFLPIHISEPARRSNGSHGMDRFTRCMA